ncbi:MAG: glutamate-5-semialdehyde dehydrogenase [Spirochaetia bacterium]|nr:glutamate-5-semialdehyde dehydrogenase [Spirochaetia bacterium]
MDIKETVTARAKRAKAASYAMMRLSTEKKNSALKHIADGLNADREAIKAANKKDIETAGKSGLSAAFIDRLTITDRTMASMIKSLNDVISLPDPVGEVTFETARPNGMKVQRVRMPLGVIGIIFESRPNVCVEASSLTLKSGNCVILRGGSDAINSNVCIGNIIRAAVKKAGLPEGAVEIIETTDREAVNVMLKLKDYIDVIIPRGGKSLVETVAQNSAIPVIYHDAGICHTYVDKGANQVMALKIVLNAKVQRPSTCNAMETLLVHAEAAEKFLPKIEEVFRKAGVEMRADVKAMKYLASAKPAGEADFKTEYNDMIVNIKVVDSIEEAIEHINTYGSHHSDAIVSDSREASDRFTAEVDSAAVFVNASTRLHDGYEFGLGAEMGISNQKLHVRGPMGLKELTSEKYVVKGNGQIRE